jgi:activator of HSP90 ATPase
MAFDLTFEYVLLTSPKHVMELLTDTKLLRAWSGGEAILENKVGGKFMMFDNWVSGTVLKTTESELSYTWILEEWPEGTVSEVHYKLDKHPQGTRVTLTQTGLPTEEEKEEHLRGWTDFFFEPMEEYMLITGTK